MNSDKALCGAFSFLPGCVAGIPNSVKKIHFYVLCNVTLYYADFILKFIAGKEYSVTYKTHAGNYFELSSRSETVALTFETTQFPKL